MKISRIKLNYNPSHLKVGVSQKRNPQKVNGMIKKKVISLSDFSMEQTYELRNYIKIIKRLCSIFFPTSYHPNDFQFLYKLYFNLIRNHGTVGAIKYMKNIRLICTRYICGSPILINNWCIGTTKDGWPSKLLFLKDRIDNKKYSYVLTLLMFNRCFKPTKTEMKKLYKNIDYHSITDLPISEYTIPSNFIENFVQSFKLNLSSESMEFSMSDIYLSFKGGPQGKATLSALNNFYNFSYNILQRLILLTSEAGVKYLLSSYKFWFNHQDQVKPTRLNKFLGKISFINDPEAKIRIVAIVDYYTQLFLKKLHDNMFKIILNNFNNCDRTYTQSPYHCWENNNESFWSLDLSSATDRFPRGLQMSLIGHMYNMAYAKTWSKHLGSIEFGIPTKIGKSVEYLNSVKYSTGQPMGTYSSWISFTLAHHLVVHWCAFLEGHSNFSFNQYIILGDDIVIKNDQVAKRYLKVITKLGVNLSLTKTHVSKDTYEFAKRWIKHGKEISGIPTKGIIENIKNINIVFCILYEYFKIKSNLYLSKSNLIDSIIFLYKGLYLINKKGKKITPIRKLEYKRRDLINFSSILDIIFNFENDERNRNIFTRNITSEIYMIPPKDSISSELKMILSIGLSNILTENVGRVSAFQFKLYEKFDWLKENRNEMINHPIFVALFNYLNNIQIRTKKWNGSEEISDLIQDMNIIDIDNTFNEKKEKYSNILTIGKSLNKGFAQLNQTEEIMYGSAIGTSSLTPKGKQLWFSRSINIEELKTIMNQEWKAPPKLNSWEDMKW